MNEDTELGIYISLFFVILSIIGSIITKFVNKRNAQKLFDYAKKHNYSFYSNPTANQLKGITFPKHFSNSNIYNLLEIPEKNWMAYWGDCHLTVKAEGASANGSNSFFLFKFSGIDIPEFEINDNLGFVSSMTVKSIELEGFSSSYTITGTNVSGIKKFFSYKLRNKFLNMDKNQLPSERNLSLSDFGDLITLCINKTGVRFFGYKDSLLVICSFQKSLENRLELYRLASDIAKVIVEDDAKNKSFLK